MHKILKRDGVEINVRPITTEQKDKWLKDRTRKIEGWCNSRICETWNEIQAIEIVNALQKEHEEINNSV